MIAEQAGLSVAAVSRALRRPRDADTTSQTVHAIAEALEYRPRRPYSSLRSRRTCVLGVVAAGDAAVEHGPLLACLERAARGFDHQMLVAFADPRSPAQCRATDLLLSRRADGILFLGERVASEAVQVAQACGVPTVTVGTRHEGSASVDVDVGGLCSLTAEYVAETRPVEIVMVRSGPSPSSGVAVDVPLSAALGRLGVPVRALEEAGASPHPSWSWGARVETAARERADVDRTFVCRDRMSALAVWRAWDPVPASRGGRLHVLSLGDGLVGSGTVAAPGLATVSVSPLDLADRAIAAMSSVLNGEPPEVEFVAARVQRGPSMSGRAAVGI